MTETRLTFDEWTDHWEGRRQHLETLFINLKAAYVDLLRDRKEHDLPYGIRWCDRCMEKKIALASDWTLCRECRDNRKNKQDRGITL